MFASDTGYFYNIANHTGSSPDIHVTISQTYTFDQSHPSNWYHPVGFAHEPDGNHGSTWGGAELPEVKGPVASCCTRSMVRAPPVPTRAT